MVVQYSVAQYTFLTYSEVNWNELEACDAVQVGSLQSYSQESNINVY